MNEDWLHDKNGTAYDREGKAYDEDGNQIKTPHDHVLDPGIARAVCILQAAGVETTESCEGRHDRDRWNDKKGGHCFEWPTIRFNGTPRCGMLALGIALKQCWEIRALHRTWHIEENEVTGPEWELVFHKTPDPVQCEGQQSPSLSRSLH